jgi:cytochrome c peroxidase
MDFTAGEAATRVGLTPDDVSRALASYVRSILSAGSRFDRFVDGDRAALSDDEQRGLAVFRGKGNCTACHVGPNFTDERTHVTGVAWTSPGQGQPPVLKDEGGGRGAFKTPTLREIARTAPYMHDGSLATLDEVVDFYDRGGNPNPAMDPEMRPSRFTADEKRALLAFLQTLSGVVQDGPR